ncbi:hypothetical protein CEV32_1326 [Brucella rhizosphaerae]|uniref:Uncharacterized protein n=1 Tax=Brucella rhizosphaerae TaxID=571254 RepID=A0A256FAJ3_9HYPH|nr:hypothetical protein CEV32_1326 [Brucella rhizosphaerae]
MKLFNIVAVSLTEHTLGNHFWTDSIVTLIDFPHAGFR